MSESKEVKLALALVRIANELIHIDKGDLTTAEKNILRHLLHAGAVIRSETESGYALA